MKKNYLKFVLLFLVAIIISCGNSFDKGAESAIKSALDDLTKGNVSQFISKIIPSQQNKYKSFIRNAPYFTTLKSYSMTDLSKNTDENSAQAVAYLTFPKNTRTMFRIYLNKINGKWLINFKETYDAEKRKNGSFAFSAIQYK